MKKKRKIIRPRFPIFEFIFTGFYLFVFAITSIKIIQGESGLILLNIFGLGGLAIGYWMTNKRNKVIEIINSSIKIRDYLKIKSDFYQKEDLKGFELYETYDSSGLVLQIRLIDKQGKKIVFIKDSYSDYGRIVKLLKRMDIPFIGKKLLKSKFKYKYGALIGFGTTLVMLLFLLTRLLK